MSKYGEIIQYGYDPFKDNIYKLFVQYFGDPIMTKIKNIENYTMYICKIHAILGIEYRYLIIFTPQNNNPIGKTEKLSNLEWISFQTRTLQDDHDLQYHTYIPRRIPDLDKKIQLKDKTDTSYVYSVSELPIQIILLPKTKDMDYSQSGSVVSALETYQTLINFI
jgi:hypothetical protein